MPGGQRFEPAAVHQPFTLVCRDLTISRSSRKRLEMPLGKPFANERVGRPWCSLVPDGTHWHSAGSRWGSVGSVPRSPTTSSSDATGGGRATGPEVNGGKSATAPPGPPGSSAEGPFACFARHPDRHGKALEPSLMELRVRK